MSIYLAHDYSANPPSTEPPPTMSFSTHGCHILLDAYGIPPETLTDIEHLQCQLLTAAKQAGATVLFQHFHHFGEGQGITGVILLAESHISIHTWPESNFAAIDIFMCGQADAKLCQSLICQALGGDTQDITIIQRGQK